MTLTEAAQLLARHIAQGRGDWQLGVHQWQHGLQDVTDLAVREGCETVELYSGTNPTPPAEAQVEEDLIGDYDPDDLI